MTVESFGLISYTVINHVGVIVLNFELCDESRYLHSSIKVYLGTMGGYKVTIGGLKNKTVAPAKEWIVTIGGIVPY